MHRRQTTGEGKIAQLDHRWDVSPDFPTLELRQTTKETVGVTRGETIIITSLVGAALTL